jgi:hypothetical protein
MRRTTVKERTIVGELARQHQVSGPVAVPVLFRLERHQRVDELTKVALAADGESRLFREISGDLFALAVRDRASDIVIAEPEAFLS